MDFFERIRNVFAPANLSLPKQPQGNLEVQRVRSHIDGRANMLRALTPQNVVGWLEAYDRGELSGAAYLMDQVYRRDDRIRAVAAKREKMVSRCDWDIVPYESAEAQKGEVKRQRQALLEFYQNLRVTHALDHHERGGVSRLIRQMQRAQSFRWAAHEITWQLPTSGRPFSAELKYVPLWFFEARNGELRFLETDEARDGIELDPRGWLVTAGEGLMEPALVLYLFKILPMKDWLTYCERNGMPGVKGVTDAAPGSEEWQAAFAAVQDFGAEYRALMSRGTEIEAIDLSAKGELPYPALIDYCNRQLSILYLGCDLSTESQGNDAVGASLQQEATDLIQDDDIANINDALSDLTRLALRYLFGDDVEPLVYFHLQAPDRKDRAAFIAEIRDLTNLGYRVPKSYVEEELGIPQAGKSEEALEPSQSASPFDPQQPRAAANASAADDVTDLAEALAADFSEAETFLQALDAAATPEEFADAVQAFLDALPRLVEEARASGKMTAQLEGLLTRELISGAVTAASPLS